MQDPTATTPSSGQDGPVQTGRTQRRLVAGVGLIALVGAATYVGTLPLGSARLAPSSDGPRATWSILEGIAIGQAAPDFTRTDRQEPLLIDLDGKPIRLADFAGRPLWIVFWATWCAPCQEEAPAILAAFHGHRADNLAVLAIDIQEPVAAIRDYVRAHDLDYTIGSDPTAAVRARFGGEGLPAHVFLDGHGVIRDRYLGQLTAALMEQHLRSIIGS